MERHSDAKRSRLTMLSSHDMDLLLVIALLCTTADSVDLYPTQLSSQAVKLSSECVSKITECPLTQTYCASNLCHICTGLGINPPLEPCCDAPTPTKCFANNYINGVTSTAASIPSASLASTILAGSIACNSLYGIYYSCQAATPGIQNSYFSDQQSCYCSTSGTFAPGYFDGYWSSCLSFVSKYDPSEYSQLGPTGGGVFSGTFTGIGISHGLGSSPCAAWNRYTMTATPKSLHSMHATPPPQTRTSSQGGNAGPTSLKGGVQKVFVVIVVNVYLAVHF